MKLFLASLLIFISLTSCDLLKQDETIKSYSIIYNANGGTGTMSPQVVSENSEVSLSENTLRREGYRFVGWNTSPDGLGTSYLNKSKISITNKNIILFAQWATLTNKLFFDSNGGAGTMPPQLIKSGETVRINPITFTNPEFNFVGWSTSPTGDSVIYSDNSSFTMGEHDVVLYAQWSQKPIYMITFDPNTGSGSSTTQDIVEGFTVQLSGNPFSKTGHSFVEWNTLANGTGISYLDLANYTMGNENRVLYAIWSPNTYSVSFNSNGGSGSMESKLITFESTISLPSNSFSNTGHTFAGWNTLANGTGTSYSDLASYTMGHENAVLYAIWNPNPYTISFNANGGTGVAYQQTIIYGSTEALIANTFSKTGYTFYGWNTIADGSGTFYSDTENYLMSSGDTILYAQWSKPFTTKWEITTNKLHLPLDPNGKYFFRIDWGDGNTEQVTTTNGLQYIEHNYSVNGNYTVVINGYCEGFGYPKPLYRSLDDGELLDVTSWGLVKIRDGGSQFASCSKLTHFSATDNPDLSNVTDMSFMFYGTTVFNGDLSGWDVSKATNMSSMFKLATVFNKNISGWDVSKVTDFSALFYGAEAFDQNIGGWTVSSAIDMSHMFSGAKAFNQPLTNWNVSNVTNMRSMFGGATLFNKDISNWTTSSVTNISWMFSATTAFNQPIGAWDVSNVVDMSSLFQSATAFNQDLSTWNTSNVKNMSWVFARTVAFNKPIGSWDVSKVTNFSYLFYLSEAFNQNIEAWTVSNTADMSGMFDGSLLVGTEPSWYVHN